MSDSGDNLIHGRITSGLTAGTLARRTIEFVRSQLPHWRDDPDRGHVEAEEALNGQLCKFLNVAARSDFPVAHFHHEERQTGRRRVDLSASADSNILVGHSKYQPFLVLEGKRLPAPATNREREYVIGRDRVSGGIERFKLGLHGRELNIAAIIGYVQRGSLPDWFVTINEWLTDLANSAEANWTIDELLAGFEHNPVARASVSSSTHARTNGVSNEIQLEHLWVDMT